jgi:tetratricopeptide (TPR) repeat protein
MSNHSGTAVLVAAFITGLFCAPCQAAETVFGGSYAKDCQTAAEHAAYGRGTDDNGIFACNLAIGIQALTRRDLAGTYVNRGILALAGRQADTALGDFDTAIAMLPNLGGAYANRGAALIAKGEWAAGIAEIDRGLTLGGPEPEKSYFNRGLAREQLGDLKGAYFDYLQAEKLKPDWADPARELERFKVTTHPEVSG